MQALQDLVAFPIQPLSIHVASVDLPAQHIHLLLKCLQTPGTFGHVSRSETFLSPLRDHCKAQVDSHLERKGHTHALETNCEANRRDSHLQISNLLEHLGLSRGQSLFQQLCFSELGSQLRIPNGDLPFQCLDHALDLLLLQGQALRMRAPRIPVSAFLLMSGANDGANRVTI
jgi:hypothetical protein